ncbi:MAG TPA: Glu-tRNA(Gln) amidotransferase subunit GatE [bacterium]|nr:Glu-tRNA(Gln) amidotransferase subunit GatE [bacterium]HNT66459.1 Glu-tRNA(Gln) amidotransferase subunit GatE [bacterium]
MSDFASKPFSQIEPADYAAVGFRSGLEIHQQLLTRKKLFCRCPAGRYSDRYDAEILRHMRPTLSELGEYDGTALMEFKTRKEIIYRIQHETVCTYEMDDTPPFELNDEALDRALAIGTLYGCTLIDELHIARKQYLDGSIPTGFQRTTIVGVDGSIPYKNRQIHIIQLGLEEDACREVSDIGHQRVYLTDRLGMPLIETVTAPDMTTPQETAQVAEILRRLVRSTGLVRTGIGAARQDVNVSVNGGTRIEIKGVPRIPAIPLLTYNEALRQWNLLRLRDELRQRGITSELFKAQVREVTRLLRRTRYQPLRQAIDHGLTVQCVTLRGFRGLLRWQTQTQTLFAKEISDRVRVIACLTTLPNIIHSDTLSETLSSSEWQALQKCVAAEADDTLVLVWGNPLDAETGAKEIMIRAQEATLGVPSETRQALADGTTGFERILPGPDRMYPDTDLPPLRVTLERRERIKAGLPQPIWEREALYRQLAIPADTIEALAVSPWADLFLQAVDEWKLSPTRVAVALIQYPKRLRKKGLPIEELSAEMIRRIMVAVRDGMLTADGLLEAMETSLRNKAWQIPPLITTTELQAAIDAALQQTAGMQNNLARQKRCLGLLMQNNRGRIHGAEAAKQVRAALEEAAARVDRKG